MTIERKDYTAYGTVLVETADFVCKRGTSTGRFREHTAKHDTWLIINKMSGIVEAEGPDMAGAIQAVYSFQRRLDRVMANPTEEPRRSYGAIDLSEIFGGEGSDDGGGNLN